MLKSFLDGAACQSRLKSFQLVQVLLRRGQCAEGGRRSEYMSRKLPYSGNLIIEVSQSVDL